jgi:polysaccharide biosynthesis protein PslG
VFGFNAYTTPTTVLKQRAVGASATRMFIAWSQAEPLPGVWDWDDFDQQYQEILAGGMRPLIVAFAAPCWAQSATTGCPALYASPPAPSYDSAWSAYVRELAVRYPRAIGIEVWNEPNLTTEFWPNVDPVRYTQLLKEAYLAVKSVDPTMPVISGGLLLGDGTGTSPWSGYADQTFLTDMYAAGAAKWMNGLGVHVYPSDGATAHSPETWDPAAMVRWLAAANAVRNAAGAPSVPIWITEMGVSTSGEPGFPVPVTPAQQATDLMTMLHTAEADTQVHLAFVDTLQDADSDLPLDLLSNLGGALLNDDVFFNEVIEGLGVFDYDWTPKPAACELSEALGGTLACR